MMLIYDCIKECFICYRHCTTSGHFEIHCSQKQMHENSHQASIYLKVIPVLLCR